MSPEPKALILQLLREKVALKQTVYEHTEEVFETIRAVLKEMLLELQQEVRKIKKDIALEYSDRGDFESLFTLSDDTLVFILHSNVFTFESNHEIWKTSYVQQQPYNAFCGKIDIYNFLSDSFKYNRDNDVGYLIGRIFINQDRHFFMEGRRQLGFLYNDFPNAVLDRATIRKVLDSALLYSMDFDPFTPPYDKMGPVTVKAVLDLSVQNKIATGKRLGFRFQADSGSMELP